MRLRTGADPRRQRADAAFALPTLYEALKRRGWATRSASRPMTVLAQALEDLLSHPPQETLRGVGGRPGCW